MNRISLPDASAAAIRAHALHDYPNECCGFLIGEVDASTELRTVHRTLPVRNEAADDRRRRFAIDPGTLADLEERLEPEGLTVLGFYHSHPDRPSEPSQFDTEHAWPWYAYLIVRVTPEQADSMGTYVLDRPSREFRAMPMVRGDAGTAAFPPAPAPVSAASSEGR